MDALFNERWQACLSPFDGDCLFANDLISVEDLRVLLTVIIPELQRASGSQALYTVDDWHRHDGFITQRRLTDWTSLAGLSRSAEALIESDQGDDYVYRSFYPEDLSFLLRYDVVDQSEAGRPGFWGAFDVSAGSPTIARIFSLVPPALQPEFRIEASKGYFDRTYAG